MGDCPLVIDLRHRRCVVVGAGPVALRRVDALAGAGAEVIVVAPHAREEISDAGREGRLEWRQRPYDPADLDGATLVVAATDDAGVNDRVAADARARGILVNRADDASAGDVRFPAVARGRRWTVAVSTDGASPTVAAWLRDRAAESIGEPARDGLDTLLDWLDDARSRGKAVGADPAARAAACRRVLGGGVLEALRDGDLPGARRRFDSALAADTEGSA